MDKQQSLELYAKGKTEWNKWAEGLLAKKKRWKEDAKADFGGYR